MEGLYPATGCDFTGYASPVLPSAAPLQLPAPCSRPSPAPTPPPMSAQVVLFEEEGFKCQSRYSNQIAFSVDIALLLKVLQPSGAALLAVKGDAGALLPPRHTAAVVTAESRPSPYC